MIIDLWQLWLMFAVVCAIGFIAGKSL